MTDNHIPVRDLPYCKYVKDWLTARYGKKQAEEIWGKTEKQYHAYLPDQPPIAELQDFVQNMFFRSFTKLGRIFNLNRSFDMRLIDKIFRKSGNNDRKDIFQYPDGFINVDEPYDARRHAARYRFTQCPNAEFAKKHNLLHVLPLMCNGDFFGIGQLHGTLIRCGTCGNSDVCDYCVVGNQNPLAEEYEIETDEGGFLVSRRKKSD